ncbi:putative sugar uptake ABC transporter periplasmic solute-binding protein [Candidatus Moduliflexus flocculans]|uniref:Putative sugar uptake ABC transporter periplasmic solute-binding protein n=1 Tax=Candidatus Moduliflexus flocculans TaxID=1499966 RepID=A0A081BM12_9BACT|nr:putative sugar uptake ABC transporter periplasmic solute-binding protein [Candidatus Moduliflexus flocculans]
MKHFFKAMSVAVAVLMGVAMVGQTADAQCKEKHDKKIVVGFSQIGAESAWRAANTESIQKEAEKRKDCIELKFSDAQQKQENQIKAIRSFIAQGVDVIAFSPVVESGWEPVLKEAKDAGIPVILSDRAVDVSDDTLWVTFMGSDFVEEGRRTAQWLVDNYEKVKRADKTMDKVRIVELQGTVGSAPANDRFAGFREVLKDHPNFEIVKTQSADFTRAGGKQVMEAFLKAEGGDKIDVVYGHNDDSALGAIQAIEEAGLKPGKDIIIVSIDAVRGAFEAMIEGKLNATIECSPLLGPQLFDAVEDLALGKELPKRIVTEEGVFPAEVAKEVLPQRTY